MRTFNPELASFTRGPVVGLVINTLTFTAGCGVVAMYAKWIDRPLVLGMILFLPVAVLLVVRLGFAMKKFSCPVCREDEVYRQIAIEDSGCLKKYYCPHCGQVLLFER